MNVEYRLPGGLVTLAVSPEVARALSSTGRAIRRNDKQFAERFQSLSEITPTEDQGKARARDRDERGGSQWSGPHFVFDLLLGLNYAWPVPTGKGLPCAVCRDAKLAPNALCLWCNKSGRDLAIGRPTAAEIAKLQRAHPKTDGRLAGGVDAPKPGAPLTRRQRRALQHASIAAATAERTHTPTT